MQEPAETSRQAIIREIKEELDTTIQVEEYFDTVEYDYPNFHLSMECFIRFYFSAWKFPSVFEFAIASLGGKYFITIFNNSGHYVYCFQKITPLQYIDKCLLLRVYPIAIRFRRLFFVCLAS